MNVLAARLRFDYDIFVESQSGDYHYDAVSGSWGGIVGKLLLGEADIGMPHTISALGQRESAIDYTIPFDHSNGIAIMMNSQRRQFKWFEFVMVFDWRVWTWMLVAFLLTR